MVDHGVVRSGVKPVAEVIDDYSVWISTDIKEITEPGIDGQAGFTGYEYHLVQYDKDEYIHKMDSTVTDLQEALCGIYESTQA